MALSLFLAKIIGLALVCIAASLLIQKKNIGLLFEAYKNPSVVYITGVVEIFLGLTLVVSHNIWSYDFRTIITCIGWLLLIRDAGRVLFSTRVPELLTKLKTMGAYFTPLLLLILLLVYILPILDLRPKEYLIYSLLCSPGKIRTYDQLLNRELRYRCATGEQKSELFCTKAE